MMKKIFIIFLFLFGAVFSVRAEEIKNFNSQISVNKNGTISVKETIVYDFGDVYRHGIYRTLPFVKTNQDGKQYRLDYSGFNVNDESSSPYQFQETTSGNDISLKIGDPAVTITGVHTYVIVYQVAGALTYFSDHDELYWNVTGNGWNIPIDSTSAEISLPTDTEGVRGACYTGVLGSKDSNCSFSYRLGTEKIMANSVLPANEGLTAVVGFPKNIVSVLEAKPYTPFSQTWLGMLLAAFMVLVGFAWYVGAPVLIIYLWIRYGRDPKPTVGEVSAWFDPPKSVVSKRFLLPAEVGTLGDETADLKDVSATIVDLARRGYLKIEERSKGDFYFVKKKDYGSKSGLLPYETTLLEAFFSSGTEFHLKDENIYSDIESVKKLLYKDVVDEKLFDKNPETTRTIYYVIALVALFTGNIPLTLVAFIFGRIMPRKTQDGSNSFAVAKSLKNFLTTQERQLEFQADKQLMFERLLPFAIVFGVEKIWAKRFADLELKPPTWYQGYYGGTFNSWIFIGSLNSSFNSFQTVATPMRSSSGFSSGFGGGGFSGGGGGGGGGGSW
ncbi:DUF2207 domain-containing protein [Patescibacteria group bacterium]|nr:DUF2207 domain-containing protein [Patescibacteria group bacterium]